MVFAGENLIYEKTAPSSPRPNCLPAIWPSPTLTFDRPVAERRRSTTWARADDAPEATAVEFSFEGVLADEPVLRNACDIDRVFPRAPFVPADHGDLPSVARPSSTCRPPASRPALPIRVPRRPSSVFRAA